jgi:hypothetical protein
VSETRRSNTSSAPTGAGMQCFPFHGLRFGSPVGDPALHPWLHSSRPSGAGNDLEIASSCLRPSGPAGRRMVATGGAARRRGAKCADARTLRKRLEMASSGLRPSGPAGRRMVATGGAARSAWMREPSGNGSKWRRLAFAPAGRRIVATGAAQDRRQAIRSATRGRGHIPWPPR